MLEYDRHYMYFILLRIMRNTVMWTLSSGKINVIMWMLPIGRRNIIIMWMMSMSRKYYYCVNVANEQEILLLYKCH